MSNESEHPDYHTHSPDQGETTEGEWRMTPWQFACDWYGFEEIASRIQRLTSVGIAPDPLDDTIPMDIRSPEFAAWITHEYRMAMNKGIQIGRAWDKHTHERS